MNRRGHTNHPLHVPMSKKSSSLQVSPSIEHTPITVSGVVDVGMMGCMNRARLGKDGVLLHKHGIRGRGLMLVLLRVRELSVIMPMIMMRRRGVVIWLLLL